MSERLPMFPLGSVLFPGSALSLVVFEPRYRTLVDRCLAERMGFGIVLIERGSEVGGGDVRADVGTRVRIEDLAPLPDGRLHLVVRGEQRVRVERWLVDDPHPWAEVEDWPDPPEAGGDVGGDVVDEELEALRLGAIEELEAFLALAARFGSTVTLDPLAFSSDPSVASNQLASVSPLGAADRYRLLQSEGPRQRLRLCRELVADQHELLQMQLPDTDGDGETRT